MLNKLSRIVVDHGGSMVASEEGATHIIDWNEDVDSMPDNTDDFIRILEVKGTSEVFALAAASTSTGQPPASSSALVHWWYYPDSYNEWIPDTEFNSSDAPDLASLYPPTRSKWYVCCRFILDCEIFNEWGNPFDYEMENESPPGAEEFDGSADPRGAEDGLGRAATAGSGTGSGTGSGGGKKARGKKRFSQVAGGSGSQDKVLAVKDAPVLGALLGTEKLMPDAVPPSVRPDMPSTILEMAPVGGSSKVQTVGTKRKAEDAPAEDTTPSPSAEPSWFLHTAVSEFEEQLLGATVTSDPVDYLKIRNGVLALCAQSPLQYITGTECRRKLPGDVSKILQVHEFLNAFALINSRSRRDARTDVPASLLAASFASTTSSGGPQQPMDVVADTEWSAAANAALLAAVQHSQAQRTSAGAAAMEVDWFAVAAKVAEVAGSSSSHKSPAECATRFVGLDLGTPQQQTGASQSVPDSNNSTRALLVAVRQFTSEVGSFLFYYFSLKGSSSLSILHYFLFRDPKVVRLLILVAPLSLWWPQTPCEDA
jgi:hypothetical protein